MKNDILKSITRNAVVAAIYVVLTVSTSSFAFGLVQVRIAEALMLLCFFRKDYIFGLTIGCFISNLFSFMWIDVFVGTLATLIACLCICYFSFKNLLLAVVYPILFNAFIVGAELTYFGVAPFWTCAGAVALGELIAVGGLGYSMFMIIWRRPKALEALGAERNLKPSW